MVIALLAVGVVGTSLLAASPAFASSTPPTFTIHCHPSGAHATTIALMSGRARAMSVTGPTEKSARKDPAAACIGQEQYNAYQATVSAATAQLTAKGVTCGTILVPGGDTSTFRLGANGSQSGYTGPSTDPKASPLPSPCVTVTAAAPAKTPSAGWVNCEISTTSAAVYVRGRRTPAAVCAAHGLKRWPQH
jgi:hypothetical protein